MFQENTKNLEDLPPVLTVPEFAKYMRISRSAAYEFVDANMITSVRIGRTIRIPRNAVMEFLHQNR